MPKRAYDACKMLTCVTNLFRVNPDVQPLPKLVAETVIRTSCLALSLLSYISFDCSFRRAKKLCPFSYTSLQNLLAHIGFLSHAVKPCLVYTNRLRHHHQLYRHLSAQAQSATMQSLVRWLFASQLITTRLTHDRYLLSPPLPFYALQLRLLTLLQLLTKDQTHL